MNNNNVNNRIMIVDDSPELIHMLLEDLQSDFVVTAALSADEALQLLAENELPDIVLLDVNMPGMNGYEACEYIKSDPMLADVDVVFLSSNNSTEEIAHGLAVGGADYLLKPYDPAVLRTKLAHIQHLREQRLQWRADAKNASELAMAVINETGALGVVIHFMRASFTVQSPQALMDCLLETLRSYGLNAIAYWRVGELLECNATGEISSMLELEMIERMHGSAQRLHTIGENLIIAKHHCVLLIKNMPIEEQRRGSLLDNLQIILEGANAKLDYFVGQRTLLEAKQKLVDDIIMGLAPALDEVRQRQVNHKEQIIVLIAGMGIEVEKAFFSMGLTETQEAEILAILNRQLNWLADQLDEGMQVDASFTSLATHLSVLVKHVLSKTTT